MTADSDGSVQKITPDQGSPDTQPVNEKTSDAIGQLIPPAPTVAAPKNGGNLPVLLILSMLALTGAAYVMNSQSLDVRSKAALIPYPTKIILPVYITNAGTGKSCRELCMIQVSGRSCASVGTDAAASNGQYQYNPPTVTTGTGVCSENTGATCTTVMNKTGKCRSSADPTAVFIKTNATRCKCQ